MATASSTASPERDRVGLASYAFVGLIATACHCALLLVLVERVGASPGPASFFGAILGAALAYAGNRRLTFRSCKPTPHWRAAPRFAATALGGALLNGVLVGAGDAWGAPYLLMQMLATLGVMVLTYQVNRIWSFDANHTDPGQGERPAIAPKAHAPLDAPSNTSMQAGGADSRGCLLSIVVPLLNEREVLPTLHACISAAVAGLPGPVEMIFIDDGSTDGSSEVLREIAQRDPRVGVIRLSRNFGKEQAMSAGLMASQGQAMVILDADLQHPPKHIPEMVQAWRAGADIVNMRRRGRTDETWSRRQSARMFYRVINALSDTSIPADIGDFRLLSRRAVDALNQMPESGRFMKGLFAWIGFPQVTLDYDVAERAAGTSKWSPRQLARFAIEGITAFSIQPLKFATKIGLLIAVVAVVLGLYFLVRALVYGDPVPGFPTLIVVILMLGGLQFMAIGVIGEYLGRMWLESKRRPLFIVQDHWPARPFAETAAPGETLRRAGADVATSSAAAHAANSADAQT